MNPIRHRRARGRAMRFIQDVAAAASVAAGQSLPAPAITRTGPRAVIVRRPLLRTVQLCARCRQRPAGFWVSRSGPHTARRPWCLSCLGELDRATCQVVRFDA